MGGELSLFLGCFPKCVVNMSWVRARLGPLLSTLWLFLLASYLCGGGGGREASRDQSQDGIRYSAPKVCLREHGCVSFIQGGYHKARTQEPVIEHGEKLPPGPAQSLPDGSGHAPRGLGVDLNVAGRTNIPVDTGRNRAHEPGDPRGFEGATKRGHEKSSPASLSASDLSDQSLGQDSLDAQYRAAPTRGDTLKEHLAAWSIHVGSLGHRMTTHVRQRMLQLHSSMIKSDRSTGAFFVVVVLLGIFTVFALIISLGVNVDFSAGKPSPRIESPGNQNPMLALRENPGTTMNLTPTCLATPCRHSFSTWDASLPLMRHFHKEYNDAARVVAARAVGLGDGDSPKGTTPMAPHDTMVHDFSRIHLIPEMVVPDGFQVTMKVPNLGLFGDEDFSQVFLHVDAINDLPLYLAKFVPDSTRKESRRPWRLVLMSPEDGDLSASCGLGQETSAGQTHHSLVIYRSSGSVFGKLNPMQTPPGSYCVTTNLGINYTFTEEVNGEVNVFNEQGGLLANIDLGHRPGAVRQAEAAANVDTSFVALCLLGIDWLKYESQPRFERIDRIDSQRFKNDGASNGHR